MIFKNSFKLKSEKLDYIDTENPIHIVNSEKYVVTALEDNYDKFAAIYPKIQESIRFGIYIDDKVSGGMSFDIKSDSEKNFSKNDFIDPNNN